MKRIIEFNYENEQYTLVEDGVQLFTISASDLKFNSLDFYNGIYKEKSTDIELVNKITDDPHKKGTYIFAWITEIVSAIREEFAEETIDETEDQPDKVIPLYEFAACAGDGFFIDENIPHTDIPDITGKAHFAVSISGNSMEPTIMDDSIIYIRKEDEPEHKAVGLFVVDGDVMCKRYIKQGRGYKLVPDNENYEPIAGKTISSITYLGKVLI